MDNTNNEKETLKDLSQEIALNEDGDFIVPPDVMAKVISHYEQVIERMNSKLSTEDKEEIDKEFLKINYCCILPEEYSDEPMDWHNYYESDTTVVQWKCQMKFGDRAYVETGHCCKYVDIPCPE